MFSKILIANRGEIACRVIASACKMGIRTVAVYSDADADALHVQLADEAVHIGPATAAHSYLVQDRIIDAVRKTGAQAIHPGYGFLSENATFCERLAKEGIVFIGPPPAAIAAMGDKIESKKLASQAGVSTVPGYMGVIGSVDEAIKIAEEIGYPVMIKASAGGGGKGMRIAWSREEVGQGFTSSMNEARSSFGDDRVFIEKYVTEPRHIEIQVLADGQGTTLYLGERECSIQRRHQKVIEEAPSPFLDAKTRKVMGEQAVALAEAVNYASAGTVEFIVDKDKNFYFLEMNTRLQVEHPVTELVTGIDLVEQMIRIAAGERLQLKQKDIRLNGWAVESRIYAEDPLRGFLPSIGRLRRFLPPKQGTNEKGLTIRNDTGVVEGSEISLYYDPMIAKLCTHGPDRLSAIDHMSHALAGFYISGIEHNVHFLATVMDNDRFRKGRLTTNFIAEEFPDGFHGAELSLQSRQCLAAATAHMQIIEFTRAAQASGQLAGRPYRPGMEWVVQLAAEFFPLTVFLTADGAIVRMKDVSGDKDITLLSDWQLGQPVYRARANGEMITIQAESKMSGLLLAFRGARVPAALHRPEIATLIALMPEKKEADSGKFLMCPMPGLVVSIPVEVGQEVKAGEPLAVVEAMKMENVLRAERDGVIAKINAKKGDSLAVDAVILEFE
jgi:propionyl-CoA carboxylase alpha chain